jgi:TRAP transporter 4TM/12TM fusion protein
MEKSPWRSAALLALAVGLCAFTAVAANLQLLRLRSELVIFAGLALLYCFLHFPLAAVFRRSRWAKNLDWILAGASFLVSLYLVWQYESASPAVPQWVAFLGLLLLLEGSRRAVGPALPFLVFLFFVYGVFGSLLPEFLIPHRGFSQERLLAQCFLPGQGIFGLALEVTFRDAFLLVVLGVWLEQLGGPAFVMQALDRRFGGSTGGAAKATVLGSGLLGAISATPALNAALVGPLSLLRMRRQGYERVAAAGTLAAGSLGGVLVPPLLGVGAYLMLHLLEGRLTLPGLLAASIFPGLLYFFSLYLGVALRARRDEAENEKRREDSVALLLLPELPAQKPVHTYSGVLLVAGLAAFLAPVLAGWPVAGAALLAILATFLLAFFRPETRPSRALLAGAGRRAAEAGLPLILAAAGVGMVLGMANLTGLGAALQHHFPMLAGYGLLPALLAMAALALLVGLALPSPVVYLLLALLLGPALSAIGPLPLAAHFFLLYWGLMATITPPVANGASAAAALAGARRQLVSLYACRLSLVGFVLPFLLIYRPQLLMVAADGGPAPLLDALLAGAVALVGAIPLAGADSGYYGRPLRLPGRLFLTAIAILILLPADGPPNAAPVTWLNLFGILVLAVATRLFWPRRRPGEDHSQK